VDSTLIMADLANDKKPPETPIGADGGFPHAGVKKLMDCQPTGIAQFVLSGSRLARLVVIRGFSFS
jgi:hypothetical protein